MEESVKERPSWKISVFHQNKAAFDVSVSAGVLKLRLLCYNMLLMYFKRAFLPLLVDSSSTNKMSFIY